jgi:Squalene-hopene cyclase C-terminal domain
MRSMNIRVLVTGAAAIAIGICAETSVSVNKPSSHDPVSIAVDKGMKWLVSVQGKDGGWGQDGGETSYVRQGERLESNGNDVANTAVAAEALLHAGNTPTTGRITNPCSTPCDSFSNTWSAVRWRDLRSRI